ncbi:hypothetical protein C0993_004367 [Termitomyces sp. T159_Od127]|nr:hypothetical protein C0993_004367 [Termitomyces sp. T159_Od127]
MPSTRKRAALSADDLLRRLEEPRAKKARLSPAVDDDDDSDDASVSRQEENGATEESEDGEDADGQLLADDDDDDEGTDDDVPVRLKEDSIVHDRFGSSLAKRVRNLPSPQPKEVSFSSLGISTVLQSALTSMSIRTPTPVQAACIPPLLAGNF